MTTSQHNLLLVDDDETFSRILARVLRRRGFEVTCASDSAEALTQAQASVPSHAIVDLRLGDQESGLQLIPALRKLNPAMRIVILTGYASIATAIDAVKLGATYYLPKPVDADAIIDAFGRETPDPTQDVESTPLSVRRLEWEHIQRVLNEHNGNVSAAARSLNMHRRTLQRKLAKHAVKR